MGLFGAISLNQRFSSLIHDDFYFAYDYYDYDYDDRLV